MAIQHFGRQTSSGGVQQAFPTTTMTNIWNTGRIPMLNLGTWDLSSHAQDVLWRPARIAAGDFDAYFTTWFTAAAAWKHPFFFRPCHEFNFSRQTNPQFP